MSWEREWQAALQEWQTALDGFNYAEGDFVDYQVLRLYAAEEKLTLILRQVRQMLPERQAAQVAARLPPDLLQREAERAAPAPAAED